MPQVEILNTNREVVGKVDLASWWDETPSVPLVHQAVVAALAGARRGTASTKGRSDVRGGGAKPFRQKGTGRARQGTIRAPQMKGGGVVFGPTKRDFSKPMSKGMNRKALRNALAHKAATDSLLVLEEVVLDSPKTRELVAVMDNFEVISALVVVDQIPEALQRASSNLRWVKVVTADRVNTYDVLVFEKLIITKGALETLEGALVR